MSGLVIISIILIAAAITIGLAVARIRKRITNASRQLFGTDSILEGLKDIEEEYAVTPKSVSAVTTLYMPQIVKAFPEFDFHQMKARAENVLISYLQSIDNKNAALLQEGSQELKNSLAIKIQDLKNAEIQEKYGQIKLHRTEISAYTKKSGKCIITFQTALQSRDESNALVQSKWNTDVIYVQDSAKTGEEGDSGLGLNCPNCGAPITTLGTKICEYCQTQVQELNIRVWIFNRIEEVK